EHVRGCTGPSKPGTRCLWPDRCVGQQRRRDDLDQALPPVFRRGSETGARTIIVPDALVLLGGVAHYDQADVRLHCKSRLAVDPEGYTAPLTQPAKVAYWR